MRYKNYIQQFIQIPYIITKLSKRLYNCLNKLFQFVDQHIYLIVIIAITLDLIGAIFLYNHGIPSSNIINNTFVDGTFSDKVHEHDIFISQLGISLIIVGFGLQLYAEIHKNILRLYYKKKALI